MVPQFPYQSRRRAGFTLIEAALTLLVIALLIAGTFLIARNVQDDILFEKTKSDTTYLLSAARDYLREYPNTPEGDLMQFIKVPEGIVRIPGYTATTSYGGPNAPGYSSGYAGQITLVKRQTEGGGCKLFVMKRRPCLLTSYIGALLNISKAICGYLIWCPIAKWISIQVVRRLKLKHIFRRMINMFKPLVQYRQNRGFTLVEVSITLLIVGAIVGVVALLAPFLHDKVNELKLLSGHRQLVADLLEDFKNVRAASDLDIRDTNMNNYLIDHHLINDAYFTRDGQIYSVFSPKPVRLFIGIKRSDATQTRVLTVMYDQLAANACISLVRQEANIYCQNADTGNRPIGFRFDYNSDSAARGICDAAWLAAKTNDCRTKQNASDQHLQFFYAIPPSTYIN